MELSDKLKSFIKDNKDADCDKLLLSASKYPDIDVPFAVNQILARRHIKNKLPLWYNNENIIFPSRISTEQCSSELSGTYKMDLVKGNYVCDLTGGLGVDSFFFAQKSNSLVYIERFKDYCDAAINNFKELGLDNISVINKDAVEFINEMIGGKGTLAFSKFDTIYIDPARRSSCNKRLFALTECEPDIVALKSDILKLCRRLIVKVSTMADIPESLKLLPETIEIHVVAVKNECKELLFVLENENLKVNDTDNISSVYKLRDNRLLEDKCANVEVYAVNINSSEQKDIFHFKYAEESTASLVLANDVKKYVYEPNAAILKAGAFKILCEHFGIKKLHKHSHLYTSSNLVENFQGRSFIVDDILEFSNKSVKNINKSIPQANITTRNFPMTVDEFRKRSKIRDGGDIYLFATTLDNNRKVLIQSHKV